MTKRMTARPGQLRAAVLAAIAAWCACAGTASAAALASGVTGSTLCVNADPAQDPYQHIESLLGSGAVEAPSDKVYTPARPHVLQRDDTNGAYFSFIAIDPSDVNLDHKPLSAGGDRTRTEIKVAPSQGGVHQPFKAHEGDTFVYTWRFRIAPEMKFARSFTHIHQIKANGGDFAEPPLITFTPLANGQMEVRHVGDRLRNSGKDAVLGTMPLAGVAGQWMDVREEITYSNSAGRYRLSIRDQQGTERLAIARDGLQMWRSGADHMRPKWGIYRKHNAALNQDTEDHIDFASFGITHGATPSSSCRD